MNRDDLLSAVGLARRGNFDWVGPAVGCLAVGLIFGTGLGLLVAPKSGRKLREDLAQRFEEGKQKLVAQAKAKAEQVETMM